MVKRRRMKAKRSFSGFFKKKAKGHRKSGSAGVKLFQFDAMIYGAVRAPISNKIQELVPIPVIGDIGDELVMGGINYLVAKNTSGMLKDVAMKGLVIENARVGESLGQMALKGFGSVTNTDVSSFTTGY